MTPRQDASIDPREVAQFDAISAHWWDPKGDFAPLHAMNPLRLGYIRDGIAKTLGRGTGTHALAGHRIADIGCGGGLLSEPMARMGAQVAGIDASERAIEVAAAHAAGQGLSVDYRRTTAEALASAEGGSFDVVTALEIVEHVSDLGAFLGAVSSLVRPGGLVFVSTLNRTAKSYAAAIVAAEYLMGILPQGTHDWRRFLRPDELEAALRLAGLQTLDIKGMVNLPLSRGWKLSRKRLGINYILMARKPY